ncbi:MAG TPA: hypothetical protein VFV65_07205 [Gemmatimonadales bacterium]|nr:hypothetical protein [Gemmatimonadales bacterium]
MKRGNLFLSVIGGAGLLLAAGAVPLLGWRLQSPRPLDVVILDHTVPDTTYRGHRAVVWVLNHLRIVHHRSRTPYDAARDYAGFVPLTDRAWAVRPFPKPLGGARVVYVADTYGVPASGQRHGDTGAPERMLAGGMSGAEIDALEAAASAGATLIGEFNLAAEPTGDSIRARVERLFGYRSSGWIGRRFEDLTRGVPGWVREGWSRQEGRVWDGVGAGFVLTNRDGRVLLLDRRVLEGSGLDIVPTAAGDALGMDASPAPGGWFDLAEPAGSTALAWYVWRLTPAGDSVLAAAGVPRAAAVTWRRSGVASVYYLAGDFASASPLPRWTRLRWTGTMYRMAPAALLPRGAAFFWRGYLPLLSSILDAAAQNPGG